MNAMAKAKRNLEALSDADVKAILEFADELAGTFRSVGEIVDRMTYRTEQYIRELRKGSEARHEYLPAYSESH